jgi:hypothetical protein
MGAQRTPALEYKGSLERKSPPPRERQRARGDDRTRSTLCKWRDVMRLQEPAKAKKPATLGGAAGLARFWMRKGGGYPFQRSKPFRQPLHERDGLFPDPFNIKALRPIAAVALKAFELSREGVCELV